MTNKCIIYQDLYCKCKTNKPQPQCKIFQKICEHSLQRHIQLIYCHLYQMQCISDSRKILYLNLKLYIKNLVCYLTSIFQSKMNFQIINFLFGVSSVIARAEIGASNRGMFGGLDIDWTWDYPQDMSKA